MSEHFFDTNVLIYALTAEPLKANRAEELIAAGGMISVQVLNECISTLRRKFGVGWPELQRSSVALRDACEVVAVTEEVHVLGLTFAGRHQLHIYDAMIVAAAVLSGCTTLLTEDMHHGLVIDGLTMKNPFS